MPVSVLVEAKTRLRPAEVRRFAAAYPQLVTQLGIQGTHMGYAYGLRVYAGAEQATRDAGFGVLSPDGERVPPIARGGA